MSKSKYPVVTVIKNKPAFSVPMDKRTHAPYTLKATCPKCKRVVEKNLADDYLSYPESDKRHEVGMYCVADEGGCENDFKVAVVVRIVVEAA